MKVFISYSTVDNNKKLALDGAFRGAAPPIDPIVVADRREPGRLLADKVAACIQECDYLVPILTRSSMNTQWVNQEIGYAEGIGKPVIPIVEREILGKLKGFVHNQHDLPFNFAGDVENARREARSFRFAYLHLVDYLNGQRTKYLSSSIEPERVAQGDPYTTSVSFRGTITNGFFDNYVVHLDSDYRTWNWDADTIPPEPGRSSPSNLAGGTLNGAVDLTKTYTWETTGWPVGRYKIFVRVYSHLVPGARGRSVVAENEHDFEVVPRSV